MPKRNLRTVLFWVLGAACIFIAAIIAGNVDIGSVANQIGVTLALMISFILFLIGGLLWISVAIAAKTVREE